MAKVTKAGKAAVVSVFDNAPVIEPAKKSAKSKIPDEAVEMGADFDTCIALRIVASAVKGANEQSEEEFKDKKGFDHIEEVVTATGEKPDSFRVRGDIGSAQFIFGKKSAGFSKEVADMLEENGVTSYEKTEKVAERFIINPDVLKDQAMLAKLAQAIQGLDFGCQVIQKQAPEFKYTTTDETFEQISKIKDKKLRRELLFQTSQISVKTPMLDGKDAKGGALAQALTIIKEKKVLEKWMADEASKEANKKAAKGDE
jgi:hypothetical protein